MAYKDKEKQKQASKERQRRYRAWKASGGVTQGVTEPKQKGVTPKALQAKGVTKGGIVIPDEALGGGEGTSTTSSIVGEPAMKGSTPKSITAGVTGLCDEGEQLDPREFVPIKNIPNYSKPDCQCQHCQSVRVNSSKNLLNHVSLPGDADCPTTHQDGSIRRTATEVMQSRQDINQIMAVQHKNS